MSYYLSERRKILELLGLAFLILLPFGMLIIADGNSQENFEIPLKASVSNEVLENQKTFDTRKNSQITILHETRCWMVPENTSAGLLSGMLKAEIILYGLIVWSICFMLFLWPIKTNENAGRHSKEL